MKTASKVTVISLIYSVVALVFLSNFLDYLHKPDDYSYDMARSYIARSDYPNEPVLFSPTWLRNYATDYGRFNGLNLTECGGGSCPRYWLLSMDNNAPKGYRIDDIFHAGTSWLLLVANDNAPRRQ